MCVTWQGFLNFIAVAGFVLTVAGFGFTIWTVLQTKKVAIAARNAVIDLQRSFSKLDTIATLSSVIFNIRQIQDLQRQGSWERVPSLYTDVRMSLAQVQADTSALNVLQKNYVLKAVGDFGRIEENIESTLNQEQVPNNMPQINQTITGHAEEFTKILTDLKRTQE